jgi:Uma2 family endonuclease
MGAKLMIPLAEYLQTSYPDLDREYRDGAVLERSMPDYFHARVQVLLAAFFVALQRTLGLYACSELRLQLAPSQFRIPDLAVFRGDPKSAVPSTPPLIIAEILSPDDRMGDVRAKLEEYKSWGVPHVWLLDPHGRRLYTCDAGLAEVATLDVPELGIIVRPEDVFE